MTIAFIIAAVVSGILFMLWHNTKENLIEQKSKQPSTSVQTSLTAEQINDVIKYNGYIPLEMQGDSASFKQQGETFFITRDSIPFIQVYKILLLGDDFDKKSMKKATEMAIEELMYGRITFSDDMKSIEFRVFGVEKTVEHFNSSLENYMWMIDNLINCHKSFYYKLMEEKSHVQIEDSPVLQLKNRNTIAS